MNGMVYESDSARDFLRKEYERRLKANPRYSMRAFASSLKMGSGALSEILSGRRPLGLKSAERVARAMGLNREEARALYELTYLDKRPSLSPADEEDGGRLAARQKRLDDDAFDAIAEWHHFAILNLLDCEGFEWSASHVSKRLGIGFGAAQAAMQRLVRLGLVKLEGKKARGVRDVVLSPSGAPSEAVRSYHRRMLAKAAEALDTAPIGSRELAGTGFALDPARLSEIKREIAQFHDRIASKYGKGRRTEVYYLQSALFSLTQGGGDGKV